MSINPNILLNEFNITIPDTAPDGDAITLFPPFSETIGPTEAPYLQVLSNGNLELWAPTKGATTENSSRTRTEFRSIVPDSTTLRNAQFGVELIDLDAAQTLRQVTPNGRVVIGQLHVKDSNYPLLKLEYNNGKVVAKIRQELGGTEISVVLRTGVGLHERMNYGIVLGTDKRLSVYFGHNGKNTDLRVPIFDSYVGRLIYPKAGLYNQEDPLSTHLDSDGSRSEMDKLDVVFT